MSVDSFSDSIVIAAAPAEVYALVSDVTRTGECSPVCRAAWWEDGAGPTAGSWFAGRNESGGRVWETRSLVTAADPGNVFAWQVNGDMAAWSYRLAAVEGGTELTETWELNDATKRVFAEKYEDRAEQVLDDRRQEAVTGIPATLATIKRVVEQA